MGRVIHTLCQDLRRGLSGKMILAILLTAVCILLDNADAAAYITQESGPSVYYFLFFSISYGGLFARYFLPIMGALPASTAFLEDLEYGFLPYMVKRAGERNYLLSKYCISVLLGGVTLALGTTLLIALLSLGCPPIHADELHASAYYLKRVTLESGLPYYAYSIYYAFWTGCLWAGVATCLSAFIRSRCFALVTPFVGSFLLVQAMKMARIPDEFRLDMWLCMRTVVRSEPFTMLLIALSVTVLLLLMGFVFQKKGGRLIENA